MLPYHDKARAHGTTPLLWRVGLALLLCCNTWAFYSLSRTTSDQLDHVIATLHGVENADRARSSAWSREVAGAVEHANNALASDLNGRLDSALTELAQTRSALAQLQKQVDGGQIKLERKVADTLIETKESLSAAHAQESIDGLARSIAGLASHESLTREKLGEVATMHADLKKDLGLRLDRLQAAVASGTSAAVRVAAAPAAVVGAGDGGVVQAAPRADPRRPSSAPDASIGATPSRAPGADVEASTAASALSQRAEAEPSRAESETMGGYDLAPDPSAMTLNDAPSNAPAASVGGQGAIDAAASAVDADSSEMTSDPRDAPIIDEAEPDVTLN